MAEPNCNSQCLDAKSNQSSRCTVRPLLGGYCVSRGRDTEEDRVKCTFLDEWVNAVNAHGGLVSGAGGFPTRLRIWKFWLGIQGISQKFQGGDSK
jgi:hypothetical protein